ncbi:hypothetical protein NDA01_24775 [Trichocoleus desertorum AS-A10]|uniref:hypothetical protein n=1 Tax=Trichocoleus desertorum TaxID=1481672 RepID=UPI003298792E
MKTELVVALIASGASVCVALMSLATAVISQKYAARASRAIEALKFEFTTTLAKQSVIDSQLNESLVSLKLAIQEIQQAKNEIQLILSSIRSSLDSKTALHRITCLREESFKCYEENLASLNEFESNALHRAKNQVLSVENFLKESLRHKRYVSELSSADKQHLMFLRSNLSDLQQLLRDSREERLYERRM